MQDIVTRCPECRIAFRATRVQLQAANGLVRCGACLHVFNGREQQLGEPSPEKDSSLSADETPAEPLLHDDINAALIGAENPSQPPGIPPGGEHAEDAAAGGYEETGKQQTAAAEPGHSSDFQQQAQSHTPPDQADDNPAAPAGAEPDAESVAERSSAKPVTRPRDSSAPAPALKPDSVDEDTPAETGSQESLPEFLRQPPARARRAQWHWVLLSLLGAAALAAQYVHFHADILGLHPDYRQLTDNICQVTGCDLPQQIAIERIQTNNLVVQSHPAYKNALQLDAVLVNRAPFEQPFPVLLLQFSDLGGNIVAVRRFAPEEYLMGELQGAVIMTRNQPIRLSLNIIDPGAAAVNFSLSAVE